MFGRAKSSPRAPQVTVHSVIGPAMRVVGHCEFEGGLHIQGQVIGPVHGLDSAPTSLRIDPDALVQGEVCADHLVIGGTVQGQVLARQHLELLPTARVEGDVCYQSLDMRPGALVAGLLQPQLVPRPADAAPPASPPGPERTPAVQPADDPELHEPELTHEPTPEAADTRTEPEFELEPTPQP